MGAWNKQLKKENTTRTWHIADVLLGLYAYKKAPTKLNLIRLGFALVGMGGNIVIAKRDKRVH